MKPVLQILGRLLADPVFRSAITANKAQALDRYGYVLTPRQDAIVVNILASVSRGALDAAFVEFQGVCPHWPCHDMKDTVWQILGGMMTNADFRASVKSNWQARCSLGGYVLAEHHQTIMASIVKSFNDGELSQSEAAIAAECPHWPCNDSALEA